MNILKSWLNRMTPEVRTKHLLSALWKAGYTAADVFALSNGEKVIYVYPDVREGDCDSVRGDVPLWAIVREQIPDYRGGSAGHGMASAEVDECEWLVPGRYSA